MSEPARIVGMLDDGPAGLPPAARAHLAGAGLVIGAARTLALCAGHTAAGAELRDMDGALGQVPGWIAAARDAGQAVAVLATGDPLCHGIAAYLAGKLGAAAIEVLPAPSTLQLAFARLKRSWQDVRIVSVHARDAGEWPGVGAATPAHGLYALVRAACGHDRLACFTSPDNGPDRIARALIAAGLGDEFRLTVAARLLLPDEALYVDLPLADAAARRFPEPNVVLLERCAPRPQRPVFGLDDGDFVQRQPERGLITKLEARAVSLAKLRLAPDAVVWDIGAGSGAVGIEAARLARDGHVYAIEKNAADAAIARDNAARLAASNYTLLEGRAPAGLGAWPDPDAVFVGGSGGELTGLVALCLARLKPGGRLVMNFVTLENLATATAALAAAGAAWEATMLSAARSQPILDMHRLAAQNPVWIVCATKENT